MQQPITKRVITKLRDLRMSNRYSQERLAIMLGIAQSSYNRIESGHIKLSIEQLYKVSVFYEIKVDDFFSN